MHPNYYWKSFDDVDVIVTEDRIRWQDADTKLLLELYKENVVLVGPTKKFKKKELMWPFIRDELEEHGFVCTTKQISN